VHEPFLNSDWDTFLVAASFLALLLSGLFRLDALLAAPKLRGVSRQPSVGIDENGRKFLSDPDGRPRYFSRNSQ
jgi:hypothetical protein